ncbi:sugar transferase [Sporolactobacillus putidus]|uniref:Multidrug MFS transporter n=1 Tax=Sporolactobacillus putidus TaxID=492735 RepID=A0A917S684_9BACL|nr:multidrug MFS transporter [Sporolactobacillus putidus]
MALSRVQTEIQTPYNAGISKSSEMLSEKLKDQKVYELAKRVLDLFSAFIGLILLSPVFLIVSLMIKWDDPHGEVFFKQIRIGKNGRKFYIYKFRSMVPNAEQMLDGLADQNETTGAMFKMKKDPRITRVGRILRKTSIDELPQLVNVLKGEMSLVGPRPPLPREVEQYSGYDLQRLLVKPGCTGLWQVSGRSDLGFDQMVKLDLHYIQHRSIANDFKLILKTLFQLLGSKNAY